MKRRDFIKLSSAAGVAGVVGSHLDTATANPMYAQASGFDLHPFIKAHPEAVFVYLTDVKQKTDAKPIYDAAHKLASEMFVSTQGGAGYPNSTKIAGKPNWTCAPFDRDKNTEQSIIDGMGIITDNNFIEGYLNGVRDKGPQQIYLRESACNNQWEPLGMTAMAKRSNFDLNSGMENIWDIPDKIVFKKVDNGVVFREVAFQYPFNDPDSFLVSLAKYKSHNVAGGVTGAIKNLQGTCANRFSNFCGSYANIFRSYDERLHKYFHENYLDKVNELHKRHIAEGYPRWNEKLARAPFNAGLYIEQWAQRMCDAYSVMNISKGIHVLEGIYWRDGDGFTLGPHNGRAMDFMCNMTLFGRDPFRIDIVAHWLAMHEPGNFGLFHIANERGLTNVLDPFDIPVYIWNNGRARSAKLNSLKRHPLKVDYNKQEGEEVYHLCDEPFDYKAWKKTGKIAAIEPSIKVIGTDSDNHIVMDVAVPKKGDVYVDILNNQGEVVWKMHAPDLEQGNHQVVWDGFCQPGMFNAYVKGMEWDAENQMVIYT